MEASARGFVEAVLHDDAGTGFGVVRLRTPSGGCVRAVGPLAGLTPGEDITVLGAWVQHPVWGRQLKSQDFARHLPASVEGIRRFLSGGLVRGIGRRLADRLVATFGERTLHVAEHCPGELARLKGLGPARLQALQEAVTRYRGLRDLAVFLGEHGIGGAAVMKLWAELGARAISILRADPYRLIGLVRGMGFGRVDRLALRLGLDPAAAVRVQAAILHAVAAEVRAGHAYAPLSALERRVSAMIGVPGRQLVPALQTLALEGALAIEEHDRAWCVYQPELLRAEHEAARGLAALARAPARLSTASPSVLARVASHAGLDRTQREALDLLARHNVVVITGPPGTGKTTVIRTLYRWMTVDRLRIALAAPTGRAARRLTEVVQAPAHTLHRLLGIGHGDERGARKLTADVVVVDEASMLDLPLFHALVTKLQPGRVLVLVGDEDQLPSVGPGAVLADIIRSRAAPVARLSTIFRQGPGSGIVRGADRIRRGLPPLAPDTAADLVFDRQEDPHRAAQAVVRHAERHPGAQVLSPMNRGACGVERLNQLLRPRLNPGGHPVPFGAGELFTGDRVIHLANDYQKDLFNGDIGTLLEVDVRKRAVTTEFSGRRVIFQQDELDQLAPAFALSVHKAQGSEYPAIILPVLDEHAFLLRRNLLYTAVTRARLKAILVGSRRALELAVRADRVEPRHTLLASRLAGPG